MKLVTFRDTKKNIIILFYRARFNFYDDSIRVLQSAMISLVSPFILVIIIQVTMEPLGYISELCDKHSDVADLECQGKS